MKRLLLLTNQVLRESGQIVCTSTTRDEKTITSRFEDEGLSFLTITLPTFAQFLQKGLDLGSVANIRLPGFRYSECLPVFLRGFTSLVFDPKSGVLLDAPNVDAIRCIRQICLLHQKVELPCTPERERKAFRKYIECEYDVRSKDATRTEDQREAFKRISRLLYADIFSSIDRKIYELDDILPKHGPGATADKLLGNQKFAQTVWHRRLEDVFPASEFLIPGPRYVDYLESVDIVEPGAEMPVRVITVPKTLKTPRIIAIEPTCMQYAQQAVSSQLVEAIEGDSLLGSFIGFTDQVPNQNLALEGSLLGNLATLDLSEASDRVSNQLVRDLFSNHRWLHAAVDGSRSRKADVPGHGVIRLAKFASMGSALCFPVEAMVFLAVCFVGIEKKLNTQLNHRLLKQFVGSVRVYGDDIIVPVDYVHHVIDSLETYGFKVGSDKSFWTGKFRESCGKEYYAGQDVSIVKFRRMYPSSREDVAEVGS